MKKSLFPLFAVLFAASAAAAPPADFEARVEKLRKEVGVPGMAVAIVEDGKVTMAKGFGTRALGVNEAVDADTIFMTGSTGKAVTSAALAVLVDRGKIGWDDKVIDHMPDFAMYDPWVTREITIRDLLVHRSGLGLGEGDLLFVPRAGLSRAESVRRLRYLKPATSFRYGFAYDNVLYMVAGQLIEAVSGKTWEKFVAEDVFKPAGMLHSTSDDDVRFTVVDRAYPHARMDGGLRGVGKQERLDERDGLGRNAAPAGGLAVSANDMARWLIIQLNRGKLPEGEGRLFSEAQSVQMWTPEVFVPTSKRPESLKLTVPNFSTYALGWGVQDYRGTKVLQHSGAVLGFQTIVALIPGKNVGFAIMINSEDSGIYAGLLYELYDHYLGFPPNDWPAKFSAYLKERAAKGLEAYKADAAKPAKVGPSLPLARYIGTYADPWYGQIEVSQTKGKLAIDFKSTPRMNGALEHWQYDSFVTRFTDKTIEPAYVTFALDADGKISGVTMKPVSPIADFSYDYQDLSFTPVEKSK